MAQKSNDDEKRKLVGRAISGAGYLVSVKLACRVVSFLANIVLLRSLPSDKGPALIGLSNIGLQLQLQLTLDLAREGVRRAALRTHYSDSDSSDRATRKRLHYYIGIVWRWGIFAGVVWAAFFFAVFGWYLVDDESSSRGVPRGSSPAIVAAAAFVELLSEPLYVIFAFELEYAFRSFVEGFALIAQCATTLYLVVARERVELESFAWGFFARSTCTLLLYAGGRLARKGTLRDYLEGFLAAFSSAPDAACAAFRDLARSLWLQSAWKAVLARGEKVVLVTSKLDAAEQGVYALVSNLGSIVARFIFQPVEEVSYTIFGKLNEREKSRSRDLSTAAKGDDIQLSFLFDTLFKTMTLFGLLFACFGSQYTHMLLRILYGETWSETSAPSTLSWYCVYVLFMALNGITEAFVHGIADQSTLLKFNAWLMLCSIGYLTAAKGLLHWGAIGLVLANCINMLLRIIFGARFILSQPSLKTTSFSSSIFALPVIAAIAAASAASWFSKIYVYGDAFSFTGAFAHVALGLTSFLGCGIALFVFEQPYLVDVKGMWRMRRGIASVKED